jgi:hypothetical protein
MMDGIVTSDEEGDMEQIIVSALAIGALYWGVRVMPWETVKARVRVAQGFSLRRLRKHL